MKCIPHKSRIKKEASGDFAWYKENSFIKHSFNDQPAIRANGYEYFKWYENDLIHRGYNKPAYIHYFFNGISMWWCTEGIIEKQQYSDNSVEYFD